MGNKNKSPNPYYDDLIKLQEKVNKLLYLELVRSDNIHLKKGLLNTIILDCEDIKNAHLVKKDEVE